MNPALAIAAGSLLTEDLALAGAAGLWASGKLGFLPAFLGAFLGIGLGDLGLYALGRFASPLLQRFEVFRAFKPERWKKGRVDACLGSPSFVALARILPGARLTGYTAAGVLAVPPLPFAGAVFGSALLWVLFWFWVAKSAGSSGNPFALFLLVAAGLGLFHWLAKGFRNREWSLRLIDAQRLRWAEFWPAWAFYAPVAAYCAWLGLRFRGLFLPTLSNPGIAHGGLINESKDAIFRLLPAHPSVLPWALHAPGSRPRGGAFPLIAKPDAGQRGSGVRLIRSQGELDAYAEGADYPFLTQEYCPFPKEAGVFYLRHPGEGRGRIWSVTRKVFPEALGDGRSTLAELILAHPRNRCMARVLFQRHASRLDWVVPQGERVRLVECGNHSQGAVFLDGKDLLGEGLIRELGAVAEAMPGFYIGRFDLRYEDDQEFSQGRGFKILEVNGASAEATHIYDPSLSLGEVYRTLFEQWRAVFAIGAENRARGLVPSTGRELLAACLAYRRGSRHHPLAS